MYKYKIESRYPEDQTQELRVVLNECSKQGGGAVEFDNGKFLISSVKLCSNLELKLSSSTAIIASEDINDYTDFKVPSTVGYAQNDYYINLWNIPKHYIMGIFVAYSMDNIKISGEEGSTIDGRNCFDPEGEEKFRGPMGMVFSQCTNIRLEGYEFINSANWSHQLDSCNKVVFNNVKVTAGHDGFNLHHCSNIEISNCDLKTGDDCVAGYDIENLYVSRCKLNTACNTFRVGGSNIVINNCKMYGPGLYPHLSKNTFYTHSILKYYSMEEERNRSNGDITFKNCTVEEIDKLFSYDYGSKEKLQDGKPLSRLKFVNCTIDKLRDTTTIKAGIEPLLLNFDNTTVHNINSYKKPLFVIDEKVDIICNDSQFLGNKEIIQGE